MDKKEPTLSAFPYWVNDVYSLGYWLKDYAYYPKALPLFTYMDHGITLFDLIPPHEINNDAPLIFKFSPRLVKIYKQQSKKPVYNLLNPAIHYRIKHKIKKSAEAKGSLFFVAHSTPLIDDHTDWELFAESLKRIPDIFQPIAICLHPTDVKKGLSDVFLKKGFAVLSASDAHAPDFIESFYAILKNYNYALSNLIGSYTFYSVEMGIPFSLYGEEPKLFNKGDRNIELGAYESYKSHQTYRKARELFSALYTDISGEQAQFVDFELGKHTTISRQKASFLLYKAYVSYCLKHPGYINQLKWFVSGRLKNKYAGVHGFLKKLYSKLTFVSKTKEANYN